MDDGVHLNALPQNAAAWLLEISPRTLRDKPEIPRNDDGTYDGQSVVRWAKGRYTRPADLPEQDVERLLVLADNLNPPYDAYEAAAGTLAEMRRRHGDGFAVALVDELQRRWQSYADTMKAAAADPEIVRQRAAREAQRASEYEAEGALRLVTQCGRCQKHRRGRAWVAGSLPPDHKVIPGACPECEAAGYYG